MSRTVRKKDNPVWEYGWRYDVYDDIAGHYVWVRVKLYGDELKAKQSQFQRDGACWSWKPTHYLRNSFERKMRRKVKSNIYHSIRLDSFDEYVDERKYDLSWFD